MRRVFEPVKIGNLELKNRLVRSATWEGIAQPDGSMTERTTSAGTICCCLRVAGGILR